MKNSWLPCDYFNVIGITYTLSRIFLILKFEAKVVKLKKF